MLDHLLEGEWEPGGYDVMEEFVRRVVSNATRQGIVLEALLAEPQVS